MIALFLSTTIEVNGDKSWPSACFTCNPVGFGGSDLIGLMAGFLSSVPSYHGSSSESLQTAGAISARRARRSCAPSSVQSRGRPQSSDRVMLRPAGLGVHAPPRFAATLRGSSYRVRLLGQCDVRHPGGGSVWPRTARRGRSCERRAD